MPRVLSIFRRPRRERRFQRGVYLLPGMFTVGNMFCGWASIVFAMRGDYATAAPLIGFAMILDTLDGRIARMTGTSSDFGVEFDSLADVISFGVAPAVLVFSWGLESLGRFGWAAGFLYVTATAIRLARFNIQGKGGDRRYFVGLPSPPAAGVLAGTVYAYPGGLDNVVASASALAIVLVAAGLMVSRIRYRSFHTLIPGRRQPSLVLLVVAGVIAAIASNPPVVLALMAYTYLASGLIGLVISRVRRRQRTEEQLQPQQEPRRDRSAS
ncbi:MAG: CDP-diacylglycerol--serine O-phosphatidyltransferase [Acidobacteria bacterium]|nr:CDP-diacylglycerol--serine O-phosphatidyltransferase [Acidobacteriota bacterium]